MKYLIIATTLSLISVSFATATETQNHLFILSGQSNMARMDPNDTFILALGSALGRDHITVVKDAQGGKPIRRWYKKYPHWTMVREAQVDVAEGSPRGAWVNTDDLNDGLNQKGESIHNDLHYSVDGYEEFGRRLAEASLHLIEKQAQQGCGGNG